MLQLIYDEDEEQIKLVARDEDVLCSKCKSDLKGDYFFIHWTWGRGGGGDEFLCMKCSKDARLRIYDEFYPAIIVHVFPQRYSAVPKVPPGLRNAGSVSVFDAAISNKGICADTSHTVVNDRTRLAGRESWEGATIGADVSERIAELDRPVKDVDGLLGSLGRAELVLPDGSVKKQIGSKNES